LPEVLEMVHLDDSIILWWRYAEWCSWSWLWSEWG